MACVRARPAVVVLLLFSALQLALASSGDRSFEFRGCVQKCADRNCSTSDAERRSDLALPLRALSWPLRALSWSCREECQYACMHEVTADDIRQGRAVRQFYGKWPFVRVLGIQEPASVVFSLLNGATVFIGYTRFIRNAPVQYPYHPLISLHFWVSIHTWFWSAVFHSRDLYWTERLDYFCAASFIAVGVVLQFVRITGPSAIKWHVAYAILWAVLYSAHVSYLALWKFDYGYNMAASVGAGVLHTTLWALWCWKNRGRGYVWKCIAVWVATSCFVLLELLDFPPLWWTFDAHSLWHLSTVPMPLLWYSFLLDDALYEVRGRERKMV